MFSPKEPNKYLDVADGVPFTYNLRGEVVAFDPDTGRRLWTAPSSPTLSRWQHDEREYIITERSTRGQQEAVCLVPKTGEPVWISPIEGRIVPLSITPEFFATELAAEEASTLNIYRLGPGGAAKHATILLPGRLQGWQCASGGDLFISFRPEKPTTPVTRDQGTIARVDLAAGKMVTSTKWQRVTWSNAMFAWADRLVYLNDMAHAHAPLNMYEAESLKPMGPPLWNQLHLPTSAYDAPMSVPYVDGRLFFRGMKRLACYDIRRRPSSRR
jgi:hypothetical protein